MENKQPEKPEEEATLLQSIENDLDWNLISIVSVWIFLLSTFFMLFV